MLAASIQIALTSQTTTQISISTPELLKVSHLLRNSLKYDGEFAMFSVQLHSLQNIGSSQDNTKEELKETRSEWGYLQQMKIAFSRKNKFYSL